MPVTQAPFFLRPHVRLQEFDLTERVSVDTSTTGMITGQFIRGPITPTYATTMQNYQDLFGAKATPEVSYAADTALAFLSQSSSLLINRIAPADATYGAIKFIVDEDTEYGNRVLALPTVVGDTQNYEAGTPGVHLIKIGDSTSKLVAANQIDLNMTDGVTTAAVTVTFATSHHDTLIALGAAIQAQMATFGNNGTASVYAEPGVTDTQERYTLVIHPPTDVDLTFSGLTVTLGATQPAATLIQSDDNFLFTTYAENPGAWSDQYGVLVSAIDEGIRERYRISFSSALITGNNFSLTLNDANIGPIAFNTDSDTTMADIATALQASSYISSAYVETTDGAVDNDRSIIVIASQPGPGFLTFLNESLTGGATQALTTIIQSLDGKESSSSFSMEVYHEDTPNAPIERHEFSLMPVTDGRGEQLQYTSTINVDVVGSKYFRLIANPNLLTDTGFATLKAKMLADGFTNMSHTIYADGGTDGSTVLASELITGLDILKDRVKYPFNAAMSAGYTDISFQQALVSLCEYRLSSTAILDLPTDYQGTGQAARDYRLYDLNIDSSYGALYTPDVQIKDLTTNENRYIPPSGLVGAVYAYNDLKAAQWAAPAGLRRGKIPQARDLRYSYSPGDEELMFPNGVNAIIDKPGYGPVVMGEETLQVVNSALRSVHIRRMMNLIEVSISDAAERLLFEGNTEFTRFEAVQLCETIMEPVKRADGMYDYRVVCDRTNNTDDVIDADALALDILVKPVRAIKGIMLRAIITRTSANFDEIIVSFST